MEERDASEPAKIKKRRAIPRWRIVLYSVIFLALGVIALIPPVARPLFEQR